MPNPPVATIDALDAELVSLVKSVTAFGNHGYSVFDVNDLDTVRGRDALPVVGVAYDGCEVAPQDPNKPNVSSMSHKVAMVVMQFSVIVAIQYRHNGESGESRATAHELLGDLRKAILGYKGVNSRPWMFVGEQPLPEPSGDGVVYYAQVWQTTVPSAGNFNQP